MKNPQTFNRTSSFSLTSIFDSYSIEQSTTTVAMTQSTTFYSTTIIPVSKMNGETTTYNILINSSITINTAYILTIIIPSSVKLMSNSHCNSSEFTCNSQSNNLSITFKNTFLFNSLINISVFNVANPRTDIPTGNFEFILSYSGTVLSKHINSGFSNT